MKKKKNNSGTRHTRQKWRTKSRGENWNKQRATGDTKETSDRNKQKKLILNFFRSNNQTEEKDENKLNPDEINIDDEDDEDDDDSEEDEEVENDDDEGEEDEEEDDVVESKKPARSAKKADI